MTNTPHSTTPVPVTGLPLDIVAVLSSLQDQIDELTARVEQQQTVLDRLAGPGSRDR